MSVQIHINGDTAGEAIQEFATLAAAFSGTPVEVVAEAKPKQTAKKTVKPDETKPADTETESGSSSEEDFADENAGSEEIPTVVDLRAKAQEKSKTPEGKKAIKALLDQFSCKSISDVPENKRVEFMKELGDLK